MGRRRQDLRTYIIRHPRFHRYLLDHMNLSPSELELCLQQNQSQFSTEFKWYKRSYSSLCDSLKTLENLPGILTEMRNAGLEDPVLDRPLKCKCRLCKTSKRLSSTKASKTSKSKRPPTPPASSTRSPARASEGSPPQDSTGTAKMEQREQSLREPQQHVDQKTGFNWHDSLCFKVLCLDVLARSVIPASGVLPIETDQEHAQGVALLFSNIQAQLALKQHAKKLFQVAAKQICQTQILEAALTRTRLALEVLSQPLATRMSLPHPEALVTAMKVGPRPIISFPPLVRLVKAQPSRKPAFPLSRPSQFGPLPLVALPDLRQDDMAEKLIKELSSVSSSVSIDSMSSVGKVMQDSGCCELCVALSLLTGGGMIPLQSRFMPQETRMPVPTDFKSMVELWRHDIGPWITQAENILGIDSEEGPDRPIDMMRTLQLLQLLAVCKYVIKDTL